MLKSRYIDPLRLKRVEAVAENIHNLIRTVEGGPQLLAEATVIALIRFVANTRGQFPAEITRLRKLFEEQLDALAETAPSSTRPIS
jgi:hypothetical protein